MYVCAIYVLCLYVYVCRYDPIVVCSLVCICVCMCGLHVPLAFRCSKHTDAIL